MFSLKGKEVLITGSTRGLGFALAKRCLQEKASVTIHGSKTKSVEDALAKLEHENAQGVVADLREIQNIETLFKEFTHEQKPLDLFINNAGRTLTGYFLQQETSDLVDLLNLNTRAPLLCAKHALTLMAKNKTGTIINISSNAAAAPMPLLAAYSASKAALSAFSKAFRAECADEDVRLFWLEPGAIATGITSSYTKEFIERYDGNITRLNPDDVAEHIIHIYRSDKLNHQHVVFEHFSATHKS
jgi:short-subunit dehydrogenase